MTRSATEAGPRILRTELLLGESPRCFACMLGGADGATLFMLTADWTGLAGTVGGPPTGRLLAVGAPAPHAGWP